MSAAMSSFILGNDLISRTPASGIAVDPPVEPHAEIPMSQQSQLGSHGHDMHPQELVRLSGCQEADARARQAAELQH
jgi:hypothetical protein